MKSKTLMLLLFFAAGCAMPNTVVKTVDTRPGIIIAGAPEGSLLYIDGMNMGVAAQYDGNPLVLTVESGTHRVTVLSGNNVIFEKTVFVESETKKILVH